MGPLRKPTARTCERCGRRERFEDGAGWRVARDAGETRVGAVFCLHEWDINGTFVAVEE